MVLLGLAIAACRAEPAPVSSEPRTRLSEAKLVDAAPASGETEVIPLNTGTAFRFKGLAVDVKRGRAYLGSWDRRAIVMVDLRARSHQVIPTRYNGKLNGMGVQLRGDKLYAVMNEVDDAPGARALSVVLVIDVVKLEVERSYELRARGARHHFNHITVDARGRAYVTDTLHASIHSVDTTRPGAPIELLVKHEDLGMVHGIVVSPDGSKLVTTSYRGGIRFFDLRHRVFSSFADLATAGDDGLAYEPGALYGVGGNAIKRYELNAAEDAVVRTEVLLRNHAYFNDPRCLQLEDGWLYVLANIEHAPVSFGSGHPGRDRPLADSYLIRRRL